MPQRNLLKKNIGDEGYEYINKYVNIVDAKVLATQNIFNIKNLDSNLHSIINISRVNDIKEINYLFREVNKKLEKNGTYVGCVETYMVRKNRIYNKFPNTIYYIYYFFDFILTRICPKLWLTKNLYFFLSGGKGRVLSKTEVLGRLVYCGFGIVDVKEINNLLFFVVKKEKEPTFNAFKPRYGILIKLPRVGKNGKIIQVYKLRTMHAYSEFIQQYVFEKNNLAEGGKLKDDFRISTYGEKLRKYWIDELPMIINLLKGEMKIVGVRPLSKHYMSLYDYELRKLRIKTKPGLLPPFYVDMPKTLDEIIASEKKYLNAYLKNPIKTDIYYFLKILQNIIFKGKRSK